MKHIPGACSRLLMITGSDEGRMRSVSFVLRVNEDVDSDIFEIII